MRTEPCACGGRIAADPADPMPAVAAHNAGPEHRAWRRRRRSVEATRLWRARIRREVEAVRLMRWAAGLAS